MRTPGRVKLMAPSSREESVLSVGSRLPRWLTKTAVHGPHRISAPTPGKRQQAGAARLALLVHMDASKWRLSVFLQRGKAEVRSLDITAKPRALPSFSKFSSFPRHALKIPI